jgi:sorbitol/mannitol transport system substrate-binding protein
MRRNRLVPLILAAALGLSSCAGAGALGTSGRTLVVAIVSNPQMKDAIALSDQFEAANPGVKLKFVSLP